MQRRQHGGAHGGQQGGDLTTQLVRLCGEIDSALLSAADAAGEEYPALDLRFVFDRAVRVYCAELIGGRGRARRDPRLSDDDEEE